jgi:hypothetical protein
MEKKLSPAEHAALATKLDRALADLAEIGRLTLETYGASSRIGTLSERFTLPTGRTDIRDLRAALADSWIDEGHAVSQPRNPYVGG